MRSQVTIERLARSLLREQGMTAKPPIDVYDIAQRLGIEVRRQAGRGSDISGAIMREGDRVIIGVNAAHPRIRQRFTVAHELGHYRLHDDSLRVDHDYVELPGDVRARPAAFRNQVSSQATDPNEVEANRFAAALLMPLDLIKRSLRRYRAPLDESAVNALAKAFDVSAQAMSYRLINLGVPLDLAGER
jgi:Zn-dependent peptidase ImmA (M78 family)